jgi:TolA-binding protein
MRPSIALALAVLAATLAGPVSAQRRPPTPEQRIERLEKQVRQVQGRVFPKGQPADTAGIADDPAATQAAVNSVIGRLDALERQMADLVRTSEEGGNRLSTIEADLARMRADQDRRFRALESGASAAAADAPGETLDAPPPAPQPKVETRGAEPVAAVPAEASDPAEAAYDAGYRLWNAGKYDQAIASLKGFVATYPNHRRTSWAHNLIGRSLLDKGQPRAAAEALLANYRRDPKGERAQDSLYYLGASLVKLGQPGQACKAYAELQDVYGSALRPQLAALLPAAKREARCN